MKKSVFLILIIAVITMSFNSFAIYEDKMWGVRAAGLGGAYSALSNDQTAVFYNPAGLTLMKHYGIELSYQNLYNLDFVKYANGSIAYVLPYGTIGFGIDQLKTEYDGVDLSTENRLVLAYGLTLREDVHSKYALGIRANIYMLSFGQGGADMEHLEDFGSTTEYGIDIGLLGKLYDRTSISIVLNNINNPKFGDGDSDGLPMSLIVGISYRPYERIITSFDMENRKEKTMFRGGAEYKLFDNFAIRGGIQMNPNLLTGGFTLSYEGISFNYAIIKHPVLDLTHKFSLQFTK